VHFLFFPFCVLALFWVAVEFKNPASNLNTQLKYPGTEKVVAVLGQRQKSSSAARNGLRLWVVKCEEVGVKDVGREGGVTRSEGGQVHRTGGVRRGGQVHRTWKSDVE